jgi:hypothetical protein
MKSKNVTVRTTELDVVVVLTDRRMYYQEANPQWEYVPRKRLGAACARHGNRRATTHPSVHITLTS